MLLFLLILSVNSHNYNYVTQNTVDDRMEFSFSLSNENVTLQLTKVLFNISVVNDRCNTSFF
uniref:Uncharacterized protein n=1 Tax=viral metagenome TaxID=1070528 RepID=A0A6C0C940_9ZZZZ